MPEMEQLLELQVGGMSCERCAAGVQAAIEAVLGVQSVTVYLEPSRAVIIFASPASPDALVKAVADADRDAPDLSLRRPDRLGDALLP